MMGSTTVKSGAGVHRGTSLSRSLIVFALAFALASHSSFATDATWTEDAVSGDWNTAANWTPAVVPDGAATFGVSNITDISVSQNPTSIETVLFDGDASAYTITVLPGSALLASGAAATNGSDVEQNFVCEGAPNGSTTSGLLQFSGNCLATDLALTATGGENGGSGGVIQFQDQSTSEVCTVTLSGNGTLDISKSSRPDGVEIELLTSDYDESIVTLGGNQLIVGGYIAGNNFRGLIQDGPNGSGGSLRKVGRAPFVLNRDNTYTGGTIVDAGALEVRNNEGSATGSGPVQINAGILGGDGIIAGSVTVGASDSAGAFLEPHFRRGERDHGKILTIEGPLTFTDNSTYYGRYIWTDTVYANGITIEGSAQIQLFAKGHPRKVKVGTVYTIFQNTSNQPINGTFENMPDGLVFFERGNTVQVSYEGGDGNDLTLTVLKVRDRN